MGSSIDKIHKDLREGRDSRDNRDESDVNMQLKHAISKQRLRGIARKLKINRRMHPDDATSLYYIISKLKEEKYDPVLLYKPQGDNFKVGPQDFGDYEIDNKFISSNFIFAFQTKEQLHMLQKHGSKIVCVDSTHSTNKYAFKLITVVVQDELGKGYPVAHLISNQEDERTLFYFLTQ